MKLRLSDIYELQMGKTPARNTPAFWNGTNAWVSISDLTSSRKYISQTRECITDNAITRTGIKKIPKDTLLMSFKLSLGKVAITTTDIYTNEAIMAFIDKKKYDVDIHYMYHYFQAIDWTIGTNKAVKGITLNKRALSEKVVDLPPINIQQEIAERMDNLNAVTENLQRQFMLLDELVKSQFIELFGDLEANPKGWKKTTFDEVSVKITDGEHATVPRVNTGYIFLNARNVLKSGVINLTGVTFISEDNHNRIYKRCNPEAGDILLTTTGTIGNVVIVPDMDAFSMDRGITLIKQDRSIINGTFFSVAMQMDSLQMHMRNGIHASAIGHLFMNKVKALPILVPHLALQNEFAAFVEQVDKSKLVLRQLLEKQKTLKAALMQEYFS